MWHRSMQKCLALGLALALSVFAAPGGNKKPGQTGNSSSSTTNTEPAEQSSSSVTNPVVRSSSSATAVKSSASTKSSSSIAEETVPAKPVESKNKVIRFMPHWTNTSAKMVVGKDTTIMTAVEKYCGWFQAKTAASTKDFYIRFKQTIGNIHVGAEGAEEVAAGALPVTEEILLDSIASLSDTLWIRSFSNGEPELFAEYPKVLGDCPTRTISVMMFDWLHGSKGDGTISVNRGDTTYKNGAKDLYFNDPIYAISNDFGSGGCSASPMRGMVEEKLGKNGVPVRATDFPKDCKITEHLDYWFLPLVIGEDAAGKKYTNATCRDLELKLDNEGYWYGQKNKDSPEKGLFFLDDFEYLDDAKTVKNIFFDQLSGSGGTHNFGFTMKFQAKFEYIPGQKFSFKGDDDVWVFVNNKLVVDIGGQHGEVSGSVDLDTLGLTPGKTYPFHIFYVERHQSESNFMMRTSMDLHTDASMFLDFAELGLGTKEYFVKQINKKDALTCNFDVDETEVDTTGGPSTFRLSGSNMDMDLEPGKTYFEGLKITSDSTFTIDSVAIVDNSDLPPGHYFLEITLKSNGQSTRVEIIVPGNAPAIAYADSSWNILGTEVSGNVETIGKWAFEKYPVNITFKDESAVWTKYNKTIRLSVSDPLISIIDENGKGISSIALDSITKQATFYIMANGDVSGASLKIAGSGNVTAVWTDLNFTEPPIPHVKVATIYDRNGDGRGDELQITFNKPFGKENILDSLQVYFGEQFPMERKLNADGTELTITAAGNCEKEEPCGFGTKIFTGGSSEIYTGTMTTYITNIDDGTESHFTIKNEPISDGIGPVITRARKTIDGAKHILELTFSEAITDNYSDEILAFQSNGVLKLPISRDHSLSGDKLRLVYIAQGETEYAPTVGDLVRFAPQEKGSNVATDLAENIAHEWNPWVPITGEQTTTVSSPGIISMDMSNDSTMKYTSTNVASTPVVVDSNATAKELAAEKGVQGNLIGFTLASLVTNKTTEEVATLKALIDRYMSDSIVTVTALSKTEAAEQIFADIDNVVLGGTNISDTVINAIRNGTITVDNYKKSKLISDEDMALIEELIETTIESSRDTVVTHPYATEQDVLDSIASGAISEATLNKYGITAQVINAIKKGEMDATNIDDYAKGLISVINPDEIVLTYKTHYYSHLGHFINGESGSFKCSDEKLYGEGKNCLSNSGNIFLAWNMRAKDGKLVGAGVYISRLEYKITVAGKTVKESTRDFLMGVRRGKGVQHEMDTSY